MKFISIYYRSNRMITILLAALAILALAEVGSAVTVRYNWSFPSNAEGWTSNNIGCGTNCTVLQAWTGADGLPSGSLYSGITTASSTLRTGSNIQWIKSFSWINGTPTSVDFNFSAKVAQATGTVSPSTYEVYLVKPDATTSKINDTYIFNAPGGWRNVSHTIGIDNFTQSGTYALMLVSTLRTTNVNSVTNGTLSVIWDNPSITLEYSPTYIHTITPASPQVGNTVTDNVTSTSTSGINMEFSWIRENGSTATTHIIPRTINYYTDSYAVDAKGLWTIDVTEYDNSDAQLGTSSTTVSVSEAPEFGKLGAVVPLFAIGILYMGMRKKIKK